MKSEVFSHSHCHNGMKAIPVKAPTDVSVAQGMTNLLPLYCRVREDLGSQSLVICGGKYSGGELPGMRNAAGFRGILYSCAICTWVVFVRVYGTVKACLFSSLRFKCSFLTHW